MTIDTTNEKHRAGVEDILLAILGVISGPLLWWMGQSWKSQPATSSLHTLEYWIALLCGLIGAALAAVWVIFLVAGMTYIIGVKTRHAALTYWSELFTPKFLRRILISVLGAQLAFSSQAVAAPEDDSTPTETPSISQQEGFMPYVATPTEANQHAQEDPSGVQSPSPSPDPSALTAPVHDATPSATELPLTSKPRQTSHVEVSPEPSAVVSSEVQIVPTPRQTSTIPVESLPAHPDASDGEGKNHQSGTFTPQPVPVSPHLSTPRPSNNTTQTETFVVKAGDCLWDIAHYELGADATLYQIDARWRQWWEHNYQLLGSDPHTIQPGTILEIPPFTD